MTTSNCDLATVIHNIILANSALRDTDKFSDKEIDLILHIVTRSAHLTPEDTMHRVNDAFNKPLDDCEIWNRIIGTAQRNILRKSGRHTVRDLYTNGAMMLLLTPGIGGSTINCIRSYFSEIGLTIPDSWSTDVYTKNQI